MHLAPTARPTFDLRRALGSRRGSLVLAGVTATAAAGALVAVNQEDGGLTTPASGPVQALVASSLIPKGTAGNVVTSDALAGVRELQAAAVPSDVVRDGSAIAGQVAVRDVQPGQALTASDFAGQADGLRSSLRGAQRAIAIPVDAAHGMTADVRARDRVDVLASFTGTGPQATAGQAVVTTIARDVLVLKAPGGEGRDATVLLRLRPKQAAAAAYAVDNGKVWLSLRAPAAAKDSADDPPTTFGSILQERSR